MMTENGTTKNLPDNSTTESSSQLEVQSFNLSKGTIILLSSPISTIQTTRKILDSEPAKKEPQVCKILTEFQERTLTVKNESSGGIDSPSIHYSSSDQEGKFFLVSSQESKIPEDGTRKRQMRLLKNREAARECRRKKKEYIKCLENRVAVLEKQNKELILELKNLREQLSHQDFK